MAEVIRITVAGEPVPYKAPHFHQIRKRDGESFVRAFQPAHTRKWIMRCAQEAQMVMHGKVPLSGAVALNLEIYLPLLASMSAKQRAAAIQGLLLPIKRPDCSNLLKAVEDSMKGIVFHDDSQVQRLTVAKWYGEKPRVEITVSQITPGADLFQQSPSRDRVRLMGPHP